MGTAQATSTRLPKAMFPRIAPSLAAANVIAMAVDLREIMLGIVMMREWKRVNFAIPNTGWEEFCAKAVKSVETHRWYGTKNAG